MNKLWKYKKIGEVCIVERGGSPRPIDKFITEDDEGINWIKIGDTTDSMYITETAQKIIPEGMKKSRYVESGDFLLSNSMSFGRPYILKIDGCIHDGWLVLRDKNNIFDKRFLYYYLSSKATYEKFKQMAVGGVVNNLNSEMVRGVSVPIISKNEQEEIANILDKISKIIMLRKKELEELDNLIKARFVELFGDPKHSDKYGTRKLSSCVANKSDMVDGPFGSQVNTKVDYIENGEIPVIRTVNVKMMQFSTDDLKFMSRQKYETVIRSQVLPGDVILTKVGTIGNVCIFPNEYQEAVLSTTGSCRIRVDESIVNKVFFAYNLMYLKDKLLEIASTGVQPFLNMNHIKNIDVLDVPLEQQTLFAAFVEQIDKSKFEVQKGLNKAQLLMDSLMQKYFG